MELTGYKLDLHFQQQSFLAVNDNTQS